MTAKTEPQEIKIPERTTTHTPRVQVPTVRLPAKLVARATEFMNAYELTITEWNEQAWTLLCETIERREKAARKEEEARKKE